MNQSLPPKKTSLFSKLHKNIYLGYEQEMISDQEMVQLLELMNDLLQLKTIAQFARETGKSYNGIKHNYKHKVIVSGKTYIIDNA